MTKVKICGIQTPVEAEYLNRNEVDYAGIVLYEKSKRYVPINKTKNTGKIKSKHNKSSRSSVAGGENDAQGFKSRI